MSNVNEGRALEIKRDVHQAVLKNVDVLKATGVSAAAFERVALNALIANPHLANCTRVSLSGALSKAITTGMLPDGVSAALVPLKNGKTGNLEAHFWPMVGGKLTKARQARGMKGISISAHCVWTADKFEDHRGSRMELIHDPAENTEETWENLRATYAIAFHAGNPVPEFEVMYKAKIIEFRQMSRSKAGPWATHWAEMAEVRPLNRLLKRLPIGADLIALLQDEEAGEEYGEVEQGQEAAQEPREVNERPQREERAAPPAQQREQDRSYNEDHGGHEPDHGDRRHDRHGGGQPAEGDTDPASLDF